MSLKLFCGSPGYGSRTTRDPGTPLWEPLFFSINVKNPFWKLGSVLVWTGHKTCERSKTWDPYSLVVTSLIISAAAWQPVTMCLVQSDKSLQVSALKRWASIPNLVPVRVAKHNSPPGCGEPLSGPECTSLRLKTQDKCTMEITYKNKQNIFFFLYVPWCFYMEVP